MLGQQTNPYPFIQACDFYIQPSRYEGKAVTVRDAQILGNPVVLTRFPTAGSQLQEDVDGVIVPDDIAGAADGIAAFLLDEQKQQAIRNYLQTHSYDNESEITKLDAWL